MMFYDATGKTREQVKQELKAMGLCEHDIEKILGHIESMDVKSKERSKNNEQN